MSGEHSPDCGEPNSGGVNGEGIEVLNWDYSSRDKYIREHGEDLAKKLLNLSWEYPGIRFDLM